MDTYKNKKAVVIGGTSGLGYAVVERLAKGAAKVILTGREQEKINEAQEAYKDRVVGFRSNITSIDEIKQLGEDIKERFGNFDYLFINAGICEVATLNDITEDSYDRQFAINTRGALFTIQKLVPLMNDGGAIVFTSSIAAYTAMPGGIVYSATKAALVSMSKVLAAELAPRAIRVNAVSVGFANTPTMGMVSLSPEEKQSFADEGKKSAPMGRLARVDEFAAAAVFLAHDATFVTGVNLPLDGGIGLGVFALSQ
ncbi:MAG TPA: SDR family oxidoreductase [Candidatus Saccharimonadales bacterium]|nr:SDR family oxidoreductase [Candidatus Saccharimonadales bacterium]